MQKTSFSRFLALLIPGILVAATGVGAGDLATASFTGSQLGLAILWAVVVGGVLKFTLTEGLARWQLVTGFTLLEGIAKHFGRFAGYIFLPYFLLWSFYVASSLMSASGITLHAMLPIFDDPRHAKIVFGMLSSLIGLGLVSTGGFKLFEKVMLVCIGLMFTTVIVTALLLWPGASIVLSGLFIPTIPDVQGAGITWTIALIGGVGGSLTILCYGYWIKEEGRTGPKEIKTCRIDLTAGYLMTVLFGIAMVIIGSTIKIEGQGADLLVILANSLEEPLGLTGRWLFLIGAFCAIFSSLLGVWQAIPYLFADIWRLFLQPPNQLSTDVRYKITTTTAPYRIYLIAIATIPMFGLFIGFKEVQKIYAVIGALFVPMLAIVLLTLNSKHKYLGEHTNKGLSTIVLLTTLTFFGLMAWLKL